MESSSFSNPMKGRIMAESSFLQAGCCRGLWEGGRAGSTGSLPPTWAPALAEPCPLQMTPESVQGLHLPGGGLEDKVQSGWVRDSSSHGSGYPSLDPLGRPLGTCPWSASHTARSTWVGTTGPVLQTPRVCALLLLIAQADAPPALAVRPACSDTSH